MLLRRSRNIFFGCVISLFICSALHANSFFPVEKVEEVRLKNGMTFLLMPHGETPIFTAYVRIRVGGMDEPSGMTGVSHVIEHMAFKGTQEWGSRNWEEEQKVLVEIEKVGQQIAAQYAQGKKPNIKEVERLRGELDRLYDEHKQWTVSEELSREYQKRGGLHMNATTSQDVTTYYISLPSSEIEFWAETEAERIFNPVFREFYREKDVVLEERRMRVIDDPAGAFFTSMLEASFDKSPYARPTIGYEEDLLTLTRTKAEDFFKKYYRPDQAVVAIVGKFNVGRVKKLLERTFGKISVSPFDPSAKLRAGRAQGRRVPPPPYNREGCRVDLMRQAQPRFTMGYHKPNLPSRDDYIFDLIATLLTEDRYARLFRTLVLEKSLATSVMAYAGVPGSRLPNMFMIFAIPRPGVPLDRLAEDIMEELDQLKTALVSEKEIERSRKHLLNDQVWRLESNDSLASELSYFQAVAGDWRYLVNYADILKSITPEEIRTAANKYFTDGNRCLGFLNGGRVP
jgi:predicted Zn-dependent peptidase